MSDSPPPLLTVTDLKQFSYCPRILYYHTVLPQVRPVTYKMEAGIEAHISAERREKRRQLRSYGLKQGERAFNVPVWDANVGLTGEIDLLITTADERIPVDYKSARRAAPHTKLQLMAYAHLLEQSDPHASAVTRGFLYLIPLRKAVEVRFTPALRRQLTRALQAMRRIYQQQWQPPPLSPRQRARCVDCEFRRFCNDVW